MHFAGIKTTNLPLKFMKLFYRIMFKNFPLNIYAFLDKLCSVINVA